MQSKRELQNEAAYDHYCRWLERLGIRPAERQEYENGIRGILSIPSFMPGKRGGFGSPSSGD